MKAHLIISLSILISVAQCLPRMEERLFGNLNSTNNLGSYGTSESNATAHGPGSMVGISGIVSGDTSSTSGSASNSGSGQNSAISSQGNCSDFSTSSAQGSSGAEATATGNCLLNMDNTGVHQKVAIGMEGQVNTNGPTGNTPNQPNGLQEAMINQTSAQNHQDGYVEAYQMVQGPQATSSFSGLMSSAHGDQIVTGPAEAMMTHSLGQANVETVITPLTDFSSISEQLAKQAK